MADIEHFDVDNIRQALIQSFGVVLGAAALLQCNPQTIYNYLRRYPELEEARALGKKNRIDRAELALQKMIIEKDPFFPAVRFTLEGSKEGRKRGWGTRPQIQIGDVDNRQLQVNIENLRLATGAETDGGVLTRLAGLLEDGDVVNGEIIEGEVVGDE